MSERIIVWMEGHIYKDLLEESQRHYPDETGGVLMGYWSTDRKEVVVEHLVGPGPAATHEPHHFEPDTEYQSSEIERVYRDSGRTSTYLGDWHTHPYGRPKMSRLDKRTLRRIAAHPPSRTPAPLMLIVGDFPESMEIGAHVLVSKNIMGFTYLSYQQCQIKYCELK